MKFHDELNPKLWDKNNEEYTLQDENMNLILEWCKKHSGIVIEIFATHSLGRAKYESLGRECPVWNEISDEELSDFARRLRDCGHDVIIQRL